MSDSTSVGHTLYPEAFDHALEAIDDEKNSRPHPSCQDRPLRKESLAVQLDEDLARYPQVYSNSQGIPAGPCMMISPDLARRQFAQGFAGSITRESVSKMGMPKHCCFG